MDPARPDGKFDGTGTFAEAMGRALAARPPVRHEGRGTAAAVLVGLFEGPGGIPHVWLVRRPSTLRVHAGEVSLPGGKRDPADSDLVTTALREAEEEIGLSRNQVLVLGASDDYVTITGFVVTPVVGWLPPSFVPQPNPREVRRAFSAPLPAFRDRGLVRALPFERVRQMLRAHRIEGEVVWGATAAILCSLETRVRAR